MHVDGGHSQKPIDFQWRRIQHGRLVAILDFFCFFQTLTLVWHWISTQNFSGTILMYMCRGLLIFSNVNFKMAARRPFFLFPDCNFSLAFEYQLQTSVVQYLCIWVRAYWFSVTSFSKWLPVGHIRSFGFCTSWSRQRNSGLFWNFSFKFHVHVLCGCRPKPNDCPLCRFQNGCLVTLNNVQLQSTHCPLLPSPMGWGYPSRSLIYNF